MFEFGIVKLVILLMMGPFIEFDCSRFRCSSERFFFLLSNQFEPSIVFDPFEFKGTRFDYIIFLRELPSITENNDFTGFSRT